MNNERCIAIGSHTVEAKLFKTKAALLDAVNCGMPIQCTQCGFKASDIPQLSSVVFGLPPDWYVRLTRAMDDNLIVMPNHKGDKDVTK